MFSKVLSRLTKQNLNGILHQQQKHLGSTEWKDKLFVNYVRVPNMKRILGPTGEEITDKVDLTGKTCLITGGTNGIGMEIVRVLMKKNCNVVMVCRNPYAANLAAKNVWHDPEKLTTYKTNLTSLSSVKKTCEQLLHRNKKFDIVILNAAVFGIPWNLTVDSLETCFQVNFLSQFYLLMNIERLLEPSARVVLVSSESHRNLKWSIRNQICPSIEQLSLPEDAYTSIKAYNTSKLCGIYSMHYLSYRWGNFKRSVFCAHPGSFIKTGLCSSWWPYELLYTIMLPFSKSISQAAANPLYCATSQELYGYTDIYFKNCKECEPSILAQDHYLSYRIIELCTNILQEKIGFIEKTDFVKKVDYDPLPDTETEEEKPVTEIAQPETASRETVKEQIAATAF